MSKIRLSGSNSGYVEIAAAADAGNLTFTMPTTGTALFGNGNNVISGITTFSAALDINSTVDVSGTSVFNNDVTFDGATAGYDAVWDRSDNALEFAANAKATFGASQDMQLYHDGNHGYIADAGTGNLRLRSGTLEIQNLAGSKTSAVFSSGGGQTLNFNNNAKFVTTNTGAVVTGICTATSFSGSGENLTRTTQYSHRNIIINGAMMVAQRGTSSTSSGYHTLDRFNVQFGGTDEPMTVEQANVASGTTPYTLGFLKCLKVTNGNQTSGAGGGDWLEIYQYLEDQDICNSGWNFKSATSYLTISFWVKSSVSQKFTGFFYTNNAGQGDSYTYSYQIDNGSGGNLSANTWTKITHSIPGASNLTFNNDNTRGLAVGIFPFDGTDYTTSGHTEETWQQWSSGNKLKDMDSTWWTTNDATFEITGLQLEVGQQATPFEHRSFGDELQRCRRYYQVLVDQAGTSSQKSFAIACAYSSSSMHSTHLLSPEMRTVPTLDYTTGSNYYRAYNNNTADYFEQFTLVGNSHANAVDLMVSSALSVTQGSAVLVRTTNGNAKIAFTAEL